MRNPYIAVFRIRLLAGLQYRQAAISGVVTQFVWGFLEILLFRAFYQADPHAFPMEFSALVSYVWLQQSFLALYMFWFWENDIFDSIQNGNISYELVRPVSLYNLWFARNLASRVSKTLLRCGPILLIAMVLPGDFRLHLPTQPQTILIFLFSMILALFLVITLIMILYFLSFYTLQPLGLRMVFQNLGDFLSGAIIPLPFLPTKMGQVISFLPFASGQNVPFRIYSGDLTGSAMARAVCLQLFWVVTLIGFGKLLERTIVKNIVVQGG